MEEFLDDFTELNNLVIDETKFMYKVKKRENAQIVNSKYVIGEGVSAKVYETLDLITLQRRALKIYEFRQIVKLHNAEEREEMINTEIKLLCRLSHKNVMKYVDLYSNKRECANKRDIKFYAFMEYCVCSVEELIDSCENNRIKLFKSHKYFHDLIDGVEYLHSNNVVHKDIKAANLLIDLNDSIKITDLGVCEQIDQFTDKPICNKTNGSIIYQSPEIFLLENKEFPAFPIDIWACGITLFYMITGKYPFEGKLLELINKITTKPIQYPKFLNSEYQLLNLFNLIFEKSPFKRIQICDIKKHNWYLSYPLKEQQKKNIKLQLIINEEPFNEILKPRTKYEDVYRSMTMTPYLHQLHYPMHDNLNLITVKEDDLGEFENLKKIPLIRGNRYKSLRSKLRKKRWKEIYKRFFDIIGIQYQSNETCLI